MKVNSSKDVKIINGIWKTIVIGGAIVLGIGAAIHNPGHLFTAAIIFAIGLESEIVKKDSHDIC